MTMASRSDSDSDSSKQLTVDICATLLTKTAPKLPLREELPSLGFEVIYHAAGVGVRASRGAARKAAMSFRKREQVRDMKKRRLFPKSSKRIKQKLAERRRMELEIRHSTSAVTYETYDKELRPKNSGDTSSSWTSSSAVDTSSESESSPIVVGKSNKPTKPSGLFSPVAKSKRRWGLLRGRFRSLGQHSKPESKPPTSIEVVKTEEPPKQTRIEDIIGEAAFPDYLAPLSDSTLLHLDHSKDPSSITTPQGGLSDLEGKMHFVNSPETKPLLPGIPGSEESEDDSVYKSEGEDGSGIFHQNIRNAFSAIDSALEAPDFLSAIDTAIDLDNQGKNPLFPSVSQNEESSLEPDQKVDEAVKNAFANIDAKLRDENKQDETPGLFETVKQAFTSCDENDISDDEAKGQKPEPLSPTSIAGEKIIADFGAEEEKKEEDGDAWLATAKLAFENIAADFYKATGIAAGKEQIETDTVPEIEPTPQEIDSVESLFLALDDVNANLRSVEPFLVANPEFVQVRRQQDARLPLHALCDRGLPDRSSVASDMATYFFLKDVDDFKEIIVFVHGLHPNACLVQDAKGDLPVHLLARTFMQWEAQWYETVYQEAAKERDTTGRTSGAITKLYQTMSECIEILLEPLILSVALCHLPGSIGTILPLHIAAIFTSSVSTLRKMLEVYPGAAVIPCDLAHLKTFVPNQATPLELHDLLSTDFPKWEIEAKQASNPDIKWSQSQYLRQKTEDCIRRSDLLFAYNPIGPYRFEKSRIRRLESRIQFEAKQVVQDDHNRMCQASEMIWVWICTFAEPKTGAPTYVNSVKRVVAALPMRSVRYLACVETKMGKNVIDAAVPQCSKAIQRRLEQLSEKIVPISSPKHDAIEKSTTSSSSLLKSWDETQSVRLSRSDRGLVNHLCRLLFNVEETTYPTAFVILPYKLMMTEEGSVGIDSPESAAVAVKFADNLLQLTDARSILYYLDCKSVRYYGESLYGKDENPVRLRAYQTIQHHAEELLSLYEERSGYMYLIDEVTGMPTLSSSDEVYPIVLNDPVSLVQKLLPLMLYGMLQMRGEKALSVLMTALLDDDVRAITPKWIEAAKEVGAYLYSQKSKERSRSSESTAATDDIVHFISSSGSKMRNSVRPKNGTTEWNVELSIVKMLIDMNDPDHTFHGLQPIEEAKGLTLWTVPAAISPSAFSKTDSIDGNYLPSVVQDNRQVDPDAAKIERSRGPVDLDDASLNYSCDSDELSLMKRRRRVGPVDLDESINSKDNSEPDMKNLASKHTELSLLHAQMRSETTELLTLGAYQSFDGEDRVHDRAWIVESAYSDESTSSSEDNFSDDRAGRLYPSIDLPALDSASIFETSFNGTERISAREARFSFLFDELALESPPLESSTSSQSFGNAWDYGERIRSEITFQLDSGNTVCSDVAVVQLKVGVADEGKRMSELNRRISDLRNKKFSSLASREEQGKIGSDEWHKYGYNTASTTRKLIIRLQDLEDRVLVDQIEMQHLSLGIYALTEGINLLHPTEGYTQDSDSSESSWHQEYFMGNSEDLQSEVPTEYQATYSVHERKSNIQAGRFYGYQTESQSNDEVNDLIETLRSPIRANSQEEESGYGSIADYSPSELEEREFLETPRFDDGRETGRLMAQDDGNYSEGDESSVEPNRLLTMNSYGTEDSQESHDSYRRLPGINRYFENAKRQHEERQESNSYEQVQNYKKDEVGEQSRRLAKKEFNEDFEHGENEDEYRPPSSIAFQETTDTPDEIVERDWGFYVENSTRFEI